MALLGGAGPAAAQDDSVHVTCAALAPDDAAQVEARVRATLLTSSANHLRVRIDCDASAATVRVLAGEQAVSTVLPLSPEEHPENLREALLTAVDQLLEALEHETRDTAVPTPAQPVASAPASAPPAAAVEPRAATRSAPPPSRASWEIGAGALAEFWQDAVAYGARLGVERRFRPWAVGACFGWLTTPELDDAFRADELHAFAFGAIEERFTGLRASLGVGVSVLTVLPKPEIVVNTSTILPLVFLDAQVARPLRFGQVSVLPAVELRLFPGRREVTVDQSRRLVLPPLCPALLLGVGYEI